MKKRFFFEKYDRMKYISHLDTMRFIERLFKRASIKPLYTEGFHPRPKFSFGNPVSLGTEMYNEPFDAELEDNFPNEYMREVLNKNAPKGFRIVKVQDIQDKSSIAKDFDAYIYEINFENEEILFKFSELIKKDEIISKKEKDGKIIEKDMKPKVKSFEVEDLNAIMIMQDTSPQVFFNILGIEEGFKIKRIGHIKM